MAPPIVSKPDYSPPPTLKIAVAGLGRMGKRHARHLLNLTARATLVAVSTPAPEELEWARENLEPFGVTLYADYTQMLSHPGLQAVLIASVTTVHAEQTIQAIEADKHVLCEKPLHTSPEVSQSVVDAARKKPHLKVMCAFSRRFDESYNAAYEKVRTGAIGDVCVIRSQTCDKRDPSGFFVAYAQFSGGIFVDCSIHDIDLALWMFSTPNPETGKMETPRVKSVAASGIIALQPDLEKFNDRDNAIGIVEFYGNKVAYFYASRMMAAGQEDTTEIIGTRGKLTVNLNPQQNLLESHVEGGIVRAVPQNYFDRFREAFVTEVNEFTACVLDGGEVKVPLEGAVQAVRIGSALQEAMISGKKISFGYDGRRIEEASL